MLQDEEIYMAYEIFQVPQLYVIDNETKMAYCMNLTWDFNNTVEYMVNRTYRTDNYIYFEVPGVLYYKRAQFYVFWEMYC